MTNFLSCVSVSLIFITVNVMGCKNELFKNVAFNCELSIHTNNQSLYCKSSILPISNTFYILRLHQRKEIKITTQGFFESFMKSNFENDSAMYSCENHPMISDTDLIAEEFCIKFDSCIEQVASFINTSFVQQLNITNANIALLSFQDLMNLTSISILNNNVSHMSKKLFKTQTILETLVLKNDCIQHLQAGTFEAQDKLISLDLSINSLKHFPKEALINLINLKYLNVSNNLIETISNNDFTVLLHLNELDLSNNKLTMIDANAFNSNGLLKVLHLSCNNFKVLPELLFSKLINLEKIYCRNCELHKLDEDLFVNNVKLLRFDFSENNISVLPSEIFRNQVFLEIINLSKNKISYLNSFKNKPRLHALLMSENNLLALNEDTFLEAPSTFWIILNKNNLTSINDNHIKHLRNVGFLDLSNNKITNIELGKTTEVMIRVLYVSNNLVKKFDVEWRSFVYLEILDMDYNQIKYIEIPPCIPNLKQTITISFKFNNITKVGLKSLLRDEMRALTDRTMAGCLFNGMAKNFIDLTHNPLHCDCDLYPLHNYIVRKTGIKLDSFLNIENLTCNSPPRLRNELVSELPGDVFSCPMVEDCPKSCICGIRGQDDEIFVNCTNRGLETIPENLPADTTVLYFNNNNLRNFYSLNSHSYKNITEIHADNNKITTLHGLKMPENLKYLSLKENRIRDFPESFSDFLNDHKDFKLFISNNNTYCDCEKKILKTFLLKNSASIRDVANITCEIDNNGTISILPLYKIPDSILCPKFNGQNLSFKITIWLSILFFTMITILLVYYKQRQLILSFLYIHCEQLFQLLCEENEPMEEKIFDAFIAYSSCNRDIVMKLLEELEEKDPFFKLCIHERNWLPGQYISDNIIHSVQSSKRTIIVLSDGFISSPWFRLELRAAVFKVSKDKMNKIIVILADNSTSLDGIDTELRHVITKRTYLVWGERWFWEKLKYAMPHKSRELPEDRYITLNDRKGSSTTTLIESGANSVIPVVV